MQTENTSLTPNSHERSATAIVLRIGKKLHRSATSESLEAALPILRRVLASNSLSGISLPELYRRRSLVQRKHILGTLAVEAGYPSWEAYRYALECMKGADLEHFECLRPHAGYPNLWFSSHTDAQDHAAKHGGRVVRVGLQGVVLGNATTASPSAC